VTERLTQFAAFDQSFSSGSSNLAVGDVDASVVGDEIVVADDGSGRRAVRIRVFGDLAGHGPRLLTQFRVLPRSAEAAHQPLTFVLGDVFADIDHPGQEIVVGDPRGMVCVLGVQHGRATYLQRFDACPDRPRSSAHHLAVGDLIPSNPGDEIAVADDGKRQNALVRVFDGRTGRSLLQLAAFAPGQAPAGVEMWIAPLMGSLPGAELIVGQGSAGGLLRVSRVVEGVPTHLLDVPDPRHRATSLPRQLAVGSLLLDMPGDQLAVVQSDPGFPLQIFYCNTDGAVVTESWSLAGDGSSPAKPDTRDRYYCDWSLSRRWKHPGAAAASATGWARTP